MSFSFPVPGTSSESARVIVFPFMLMVTTAFLTWAAGVSMPSSESLQESNAMLVRVTNNRF